MRARSGGEPRIGRSFSSRESPRGTERIDARGKYLIPGLIDAHAHLLSDGFISEEHIEAELRKRSGVWIDWHDNGQKKKEGRYSGGRAEGADGPHWRCLNRSKLGARRLPTVRGPGGGALAVPGPAPDQPPSGTQKYKEYP